MQLNKANSKPINNLFFNSFELISVNQYNHPKSTRVMTSQNNGVASSVVPLRVLKTKNSPRNLSFKGPPSGRKSNQKGQKVKTGQKRITTEMKLLMPKISFLLYMQLFHFEQIPLSIGPEKQVQASSKNKF